MSVQVSVCPLVDVTQYINGSVLCGQRFERIIKFEQEPMKYSAKCAL